MRFNSNRVNIVRASAALTALLMLSACISVNANNNRTTTASNSGATAAPTASPITEAQVNAAQQA